MAVYPSHATSPSGIYSNLLTRRTTTKVCLKKKKKKQPSNSIKENTHWAKLRQTSNLSGLTREMKQKHVFHKQGWLPVISIFSISILPAKQLDTTLLTVGGLPANYSFSCLSVFFLFFFNKTWGAIGREGGRITVRESGLLRPERLV